ncbi:biotin transporter BioY [Methylobacterium sp. SyP6R]|uniref:biotin transporter BioY n=1 Tax=Methylobacterium sp. SyP6R TaxID=2718876 RepID=UPI001F3E3D6B|nr:biotin transporter BioY [Methylobacterium sp. SyP6R]MCF4126863.1 biotin transporter BioY [Methylobacterium sp. SyP6R]
MTSLVVGAAPLRAARTFAIVLSGVVLITIAAKVRIPFWPVPMTLHTLAVMALAVAAGPRLAVASMLGYLAAGAAGLPVFSGTPERGLGLAYMAGPTGGYLAGYLVAAGLVGALAAGRGLLGRVAAMLAGLAAIDAFGLAWLALFVPADRLVALGLAPFLLGDLVKIGLVAAGSCARPGLRRVFAR